MRALALAAGLILAAAPALAADPVEGVWLNQNGSGKVRIALCPGKADRLCGVIVWLRDPAAAATGKDTQNPDPALKTRPLMGLPLIQNFKQAAPSRWNGGRIYDPNTGKTYDSKLAVNPNGTLKVEGCILMVCQAETWKPG